MTERVGPGTLKCIITTSSGRPPREPLKAALLEHVPEADLRSLGDALLVHTEASTAAIRDWLTPLLDGDASLFVVEFEHWSARGPAADRDWLRARGH